MNAPLPVVLVEWKPIERNTLRGFATVRLGRSLIIKDCPVHRSGDRCWVALPAKPMLDRDGNAMKDERGKIRYVPLLEWADRDAADRFSDAVVSAVRATHPDAFAAVPDHAA